jgi:hypothetical protein
MSDRRSAAPIVEARDLGRCMICGLKGTDGHHRDPVGMGGSSDPDRDRPDNIVLLCRTHHSDVHQNPELAGLLGYYLDTDDELERVDRLVWSPADRCWWELTENNLRLAWPNLVPPAVDMSWISKIGALV